MLIYLRVTLILASGGFFLGGWEGGHLSVWFVGFFFFSVCLFLIVFGRTIVTQDLLGMGWHENKQVRCVAVGLFP